MQRLTLIGMYNYDSTLFDNVTLPDGYNKETFIETLLLEHGEKCVLYTDVDFMKYSLGVISRKWNRELTRILETLLDNYNPLHNYDRHEEYTDTENTQNTGSTTGWKGGGNTHTNNPDYTTEQITNGYTNQTIAGTSQKDVSAFNSTTYEPSDKTTTNNGKVETNAGKMKYSGKTEDIAENYGENTNGTSTGTEWRTLGHNAHLYGNIGVMSSQEMAVRELDLRLQHGLYDTVTGIFANELLINIY